MAALLTLTAPLATGPQPYALPRRPVALIVWSDGQAAPGLGEGFRFHIGMTDGVRQVCRAVALEDGAASPAGCQLESTTRLIQTASPVAAGTAPIRQEAALVGFTSAGFTLDWTVVDGQATRYHVLAILQGEVTGCTLVSVFCDDNPEVIASLTFPPSAVLTLGGTTTDLVGYASGPFAAMVALGVSNCVDNRTGELWGRLSGSTAPSSTVHGDASAVIRYISSIFEGATAVGVVVSTPTATGFSVSKGGFGATSLYHHFLCLGGVAVAVGTVAQPAAPGDTALSLPFTPDVVLVQSVGDAAGGGSTAAATLAVGAWLGDGTTRAASASALNPGTTRTCAEHLDTAVLTLRTPADAAASSVLVARAAVRADGQALTWSTTDGTPRAALYLALGLREVGTACSGGSVPQLADPAPGPTWSGKGPHADRFWIEHELVGGRRSYAMGATIRGASTLPAHPGPKPGRLIAAGAFIRRTTDRLGGWNTSTARHAIDDKDGEVRGLMRGEQWYNREYSAFVADRLALDQARRIGRYIIRRYPPQPGMTVDVEGVDIIGTRFSPFALDRDLLEDFVFDAARFPSAPRALLDERPRRPVPVFQGLWSDEGSTAAPPVLAGTTARGSWPSTEPGAPFNVGFGAMPAGSPPPPDTVTGAAIAGGTIDRGIAPYNEVFAQVWGRTGGQDGDPAPFYPELLPIAITADGQKIRIEWSFAGSNPDTWRIGLAIRYYGARWNQVLEVAGTARAAEFTALEWLGAGSLTPGALPPYFNRKEFLVAAVLADGRTGVSAPGGIHPYAGPYRRPAYLSWIPVPGALAYEVYLGEVPTAYFGWREQFTVPATQIDADGYVYFSYDWLSTGALLEGGRLPTPVGMLPLIDTGDVEVNGSMRGQLVLQRFAIREILGIYAGATRVALDHPDLLHPDHPDWTGPRARQFGGYDATVLYVRVGSALLTNHRDGTAPLKVNACTLEETGLGTGGGIESAPDAVQLIVTEVGLRRHKAGAWEGVPLFADGVPMVRTSTFAARKAQEIARVGGIGYRARIALDRPTTFRHFLEGCVQSFGLHFGIDEHGGLVAGHYDDAIDVTAPYVRFDERTIAGHLRVTPLTDELETRIRYDHGYRPVTQAYAFVDQYLPAAETSAAITANRGEITLGPKRTLAYAADQGTVDDVVARTLLCAQYVREWVEIPTGIPGLGVALFQVVQVTDYEGIGATGYVDEWILVLEIEVVPPDPDAGRPLLVLLRGLNITALLDAAWTWGPDDLPDWDAMTAEQRGRYGAWAADTDTIPSDNSPAKEWR